MENLVEAAINCRQRAGLGWVFPCGEAGSQISHSIFLRSDLRLVFSAVWIGGIRSRQMCRRLRMLAILTEEHETYKSLRRPGFCDPSTYLGPLRIGVSRTRLRLSVSVMSLFSKPELSGATMAPVTKPLRRPRTSQPPHRGLEDRHFPRPRSAGQEPRENGLLPSL